MKNDFLNIIKDVIRRLNDLEKKRGVVDGDGNLVVRTYTDATRPSAGTAGRVIFNSDDGKLNIDDGTNWTLPDGTTT